MRPGLMRTMTRSAPGSGGGVAPPMWRPYITWWNDPSGSSVNSTVPWTRRHRCRL